MEQTRSLAELRKAHPGHAVISHDRPAAAREVRCKCYLCHAGTQGVLQCASTRSHNCVKGFKAPHRCTHTPVRRSVSCSARHPAVQTLQHLLWPRRRPGRTQLRNDTLCPPVSVVLLSCLSLTGPPAGLKRDPGSKRWPASRQNAPGTRWWTRQRQ